MRRIAYVARVVDSKETELRYHLDKGTPTAALRQAGILGMDAFIGSGFCVFLFDYEDDFQAVLDRMLESAGLMEFRERLSTCIQDFLRPGQMPVSAQLPLAAEAFHWAPEPRQAM